MEKELLKLNKEFYWNCIAEYGYSICPDKIQKMYTSLAIKEYNEENSFYFRRYVKTLENLIFREKIRLGIKTTEDYSLLPMRIKQLQWISKHLPGNDFCILEKSSMDLHHYDSGRGLLDVDVQLKTEISKCKKSRLIIPLGITMHLQRKKEYHINILILDLNKREVWRIEPNDVDSKNISLFSDVLSRYFKTIGFNYSGFYPESCPIKHGGLCRYVIYAQYIYGKKITYENIKNIILLFLKYEILDLCKVK